MRKVIGVSRRKKQQQEPPAASASSDPVVASRAVAAVRPPRTSNGAAELLSGSDGEQDNAPTPNSRAPADATSGCEEHDDEDGGLIPPPPRLYSSGAFFEGDDNVAAFDYYGPNDGGGMMSPIDEPSGLRGEDDDDNDDDEDQSIYARLNSFEERMESELLDLEQYGVSSAATATTTASSSSSSGSGGGASSGGASKKKRLDPDGRGERPPPVTSIVARASPSASIVARASSAASSAASNFSSSVFKRGKGKSTKDLAMLSGKTTKIMSDYQAYLCEIQGEFPLSDDDDDDDEEVNNDDDDPALVTIKQVRENIRDSYLNGRDSDLEAGRGSGDMVIIEEENGDGGAAAPLISAPEVTKHDGYATGGGEPLHRAWSPPPERANAGYDLSSVFGETLLGNKCCDSRRSRMGGVVGPKYRYARSWLGSRRVKRGLAGIMALAAVVVLVSVGIATSHAKKHDENLPDWEEEFEAELETKDNEKSLPSFNVEQVANSEKEEEEALVDGIIPPLVGEQQVAAEAEKAEEEEDDENQAGVGRPPDVEGEQQQAAMVEKVAKDDENEGGVGTLPDAKGEHVAEEGEEAKENEEMPGRDKLEYFLGHKILSGAPLPPPAPKHVGENEESRDRYAESVHKYHPVMYDRSSGWAGRSYIEALVFCEEEAGLAVCSFDAVCPDGVGSEPLGGFRDAPYGDWAWIPILDGHDEWVQAGARERCVRYSAMHEGEKPGWEASSGEGTEGATENVMCCMNVM